jgi:hypothetical protein
LMQVFNSYLNVINSLYAITGGLNKDTAYYWDDKFTFKPALTFGPANTQTRPQICILDLTAAVARARKQKFGRQKVRRVQ